MKGRKISGQLLKASPSSARCHKGQNKKAYSLSLVAMIQIYLRTFSTLMNYNHSQQSCVLVTMLSSLGRYQTIRESFFSNALIFSCIHRQMNTLESYRLRLCTWGVSLLRVTQAVLQNLLSTKRQAFSYHPSQLSGPTKSQRQPSMISMRTTSSTTGFLMIPMLTRTATELLKIMSYQKKRV